MQITRPASTRGSLSKFETVGIYGVVLLSGLADVDAAKPSFVQSALRYAQAADVPIFVAINKIDVPSATPKRIRTATHEIRRPRRVVGLDVLAAEISA